MRLSDATVPCRAGKQFLWFLSRYGLRTAANKQGQSKTFARPSSKSSGAPGLHRPFVPRYQNSLLFGRCGSLPIHRAAHPTWSSTPITPSHIGQSHHPILPTSNFSLLLAVTVSVIVTANLRCCCCCCARCLSSCYKFQGCQDCNVGPSSSCAATANLHVSAISHSYQHCPPVLLPCLRSPPL